LATVARTRSLTKDGISGDRAVAELRLLILRGELMPGEQVRQEETADRLGVSRVLLREALRALAAQGMVEHRPHQGYFVAKRAPMELAQIVLMLDLLEPELMRTVEWPGAEVVDRLRDLNRQMAELADDWEWTPTLGLNRVFHFTIFELSPYRLILQEVERLWGLADPFISQKLATPEARRAAVSEHETIINALEAHNRPACVAALDAHRTSSSEGLLPVLPVPGQAPAGSASAMEA
jgi:DNA-binding GntR family transcriptional regulator